MAFALTILGSAVTAGLGTGAFSWATFGLSLGTQMLGNALADGGHGPRLSDLLVMSSEEGLIIPRAYGQPRLSGNVIWSDGKKEHAHEEGGGLFGSLGPPGTTVYSYTASFAVLLCENQIDRVKKIYADNHLIYDADAAAADPLPTLGWLGDLVLESEGLPEQIVLTQNPTTGTWSGTQGDMSLRVYTGTETQQPDSAIVAHKGSGNVPAFLGRTYIVFENMDLSPYNNSVPNITVEIDEPTGTAAGIIEAVGTIVGLVPADDIDMSGLGSTPITGYVLADTGPSRKVLEDLTQITFYDFPVIDGKITSVARTTTSSFTVPEDDVRMVRYGAGEAQTQWHFPHERDKPQRLEGSFSDVGRRGLPGLRRFIHQTTSSEKQESFTVPINMTGAKMQQVVNIEGARRWAEADTIELQLGWKYWPKAPCDVFTYRDLTYRIVEKSPEIGGPVLVKAVRHVPAIYGLTQGAETAGMDGPVLSTANAISFMGWDGNALKDTDLEHPGMYFAVSAPYSFTNWTQVRVDCPGENPLTPAVESAKRASIGIVVGTLADNPDGPDQWDFTNTLTVDWLYGSPETFTADQVLNGVDGSGLQVGLEIVQYTTATFIGTQPDGKKRYTHTGLLRGRRGTEQFMATHGSGDAVVLLNDAVYRFDLPNRYINDTLTVGVAQRSIGVSGTRVDYDVPITGRSLMPFAPAYVTLTQDGSDNWNMTWHRRTREMQSAEYFWTSGLERPMVEYPEKYQVEILNGGGDVLRTLTVASESAQYTSARQVADFGSVQATLTARVCQLNATKGQGYKATVEGPTDA